MVRNIIFDWSGTLVDDLRAVWAATNHVLRQAGLPEMTLDQFRAEFSLPFKKFYNRLTPGIPLAQLEEWFHGHFRQNQDSVVELPHARAFLESCRKEEIRMFVLTAVHPSHFANQASATRFGDYFERAYTGVTDKVEAIADVLEQNRLNREETLLIGDMRHDIDAAKKGGIMSCAVLTGYTGLEQLRGSQPDAIVEHLGELASMLHANHWILAPVEQRPIATVGALIFNSVNQVLMIRTHKWSNLWGIPGGKIRFGESSLDALRREVKEETNLDISDITFVMVQDSIHSTEFYRDAHFILLNYTGREQGDQPVVLNSEAQSFQWVTMEQAKAMELNQPTRLLLTQVEQSPRLP